MWGSYILIALLALVVIMLTNRVTFLEKKIEILTTFTDEATKAITECCEVGRCLAADCNNNHNDSQRTMAELNVLKQDMVKFHLRLNEVEISKNGKNV